MLQALMFRNKIKGRDDKYCRAINYFIGKEGTMKQRATDLAKYRRIVEIYAYLIRNQSRQYTVADIRKFLEEGGDATLDISTRNVQRDLKDLADIPNTCVEAKWEKGRLYYFIEADMRRKLSLPIQQNGLLAFFLLKRLQPFFARKTKSLDDLSEKIADLASDANYDLFEDLDEKLEGSTFLFGGESSLSLDGTMFNVLLTALVDRRKLKILYASPGRPEPREIIICPIKLVLYRGELYFSCLPMAGKKRDFYIRLSRIIKAQLTGEPFVPDPKDLDRIEKRLNSSFGLLDDEDAKPEKIVIRFPAGEYYKKILSERRFHGTQNLTEDKKGNTILTLEAPVGFELVNWVLCWPEGEVVGPEGLRKEMREVGKKLMKKYG
jgi:predicted DNA-binding transcriptional regulator YafY